MIKKFFGDKGFWQVLVRLSMPIIIQNLLVNSFSLVDTLMVSQLGDVELSAMGMAGQWSWMMSMVLFGFSSGMSIFVSQYWGVRDYDNIHKTIGISVISSLLVSLVFFISGAFFPSFVMGIFNREAAVMAAGVKYLRIAAWSYPAMAITNVLSTALRSTEIVKLSMWVSLCTTVFNVFFNYSLIFGRFGLPEMGIAGAAMATTIAAWLGPVLLIVISLFKKTVIIFNPKKLLTVTAKNIKSFMSKALPVTANESLWALGTLVFNVIYSNLSYEDYAAITILRTFEQIAFVFFIGMCNACAIMIGKSIGQGKLERAISDAKRFAVLEPFVAIVLGAIMILSRHQLVNIFNLSGNISEATLTTASVITIIYAAEMALRNLPYLQIVGLFRAGGDAASAAKYDILCLWLFSLPITLLNAYVFRLPFPVIFALMYVCEDVPKSFFCLRHFFSGRWIKPVTAEGKAAAAAYVAKNGSMRILLKNEKEN
ncbi:MAG: MATE family efflux transporter [Ruminococcaceae bacterium]|nr:MATE family efflux transporter [Oscillospiraceae bacterium]